MALMLAILRKLGVGWETIDLDSLPPDVVSLVRPGESLQLLKSNPPRPPSPGARAHRFAVSERGRGVVGVAGECMSKLVTKPSGKLTRIEVEIAEEVLRLREATANSLNHAKKIGDLLLIAKEEVAHGEWGAWVDRMDISERSARRYMQIAIGWGVIKTATMADLTLDGAAKLLTRGALAATLAKPKKLEPEEGVEEPGFEEEPSGEPQRSTAPSRGGDARTARSTRASKSGAREGASPVIGHDAGALQSSRLASTEEVCPTCNGTGKVAVREGWVELRDAFEAGFIAATGSKPSWGPKEGNQLKAVLRRQPVEECLRRLHIFFGPERPGFLSTYDLQTFVGHFDKFANPAVAAKQVVRDPAIDRLMAKGRRS